MEKNKRSKSKVGLRVKNKFANAAKGMFTAFKEESTLIVYLIAIILCIGVGIWVNLSFIEWAIVVITIGVLMGFELVNTAIENFVDLLSFEYNERAKKIKDICAAASIFNALVAVAVGFLIYLPNIINKIQTLIQ